MTGFLGFLLAHLRSLNETEQAEHRAKSGKESREFSYSVASDSDPAPSESDGDDVDNAAAV